MAPFANRGCTSGGGSNTGYRKHALALFLGAAKGSQFELVGFPYSHTTVPLRMIRERSRTNSGWPVERSTSPGTSVPMIASFRLEADIRNSIG